MTLTVLLFAKLRDAAGAEAVAVTLPAGATVADLRRQLADTYPALAGLLERSAVAVNHDFADADRLLAAGDEVAIIPPVSGG
jgi:molybdopterin converting factor subunit 1